MGWTKRQFIAKAFEEIGLGGYDFDINPSQTESAVRRLDGMIAAWNGIGIRLGYPIPGSPENSNIDAESGVPDSANEAIYTNLALKLAPTIGRTPSMETKSTARSSYKILLQRAAQPKEKQFPGTLPLGAGNKSSYTNRNYMPKPSDPISDYDGPIDF